MYSNLQSVSITTNVVTSNPAHGKASSIQHYLFLCKNEAVFELRQKYIPRYYHLTPNINKMGGMLSLCSVKLLSNIAE
jgi:hypothetical protein